VLGASGYDEHLAGPQADIAGTHPNRDSPAQHQKEIIGVVVFVPDELALDLDDHEVVTIELTDRARLPELREGRQLLGEVDRFHRRQSLRPRAAISHTASTMSPRIA
jgi:hypothetical protein